MNLQQTSCLLLLKVIPCLGKLNGGVVVAMLSFTSTALVESFRMLLALISPCRRVIVFCMPKIKLQEQRKGHTESLSNPTNANTFKISFLNAPVHMHIHVLNELTANVLFAVAEGYSLFGKA